MKRFIFLLLCAIIWGVLPSPAEKVYYKILDDVNKTVSVSATSFEDGPSGDLVIPEIVKVGGEDYTVVEIPDEGFNGTRYSSITIPNSVKSIGEAAFYYCRNLERVTVGTGCQKIGRRPFQGCEHLTELTFLSETPPFCLKDYITEYVDHRVTIKTDKNYLMNYACIYGKTKDVDFYSLSSDRPLSTYFDDNYEYLACDETKECIITKYLKPETKITDLVIPDNAVIMFGLARDEYKIVGVGSNIFCQPTTNDPLPVNFHTNENIVGSVRMGANIRCIGYGAFAATSITSLKIDSPIKVIDSFAFNNCFNLQEVLLSQNLVWIGRFTFSDTHEMTEITLPKELQLIGERAFSGTSLRHVDFNDSLNYIGKYAFWVAHNINSITLPVGLKEIDDGAFLSCEALSTVTFGKNLEIIGSQAFMDASIESISIPSSVKTIGNYAFRGCGMKNAIVEDGLKPITIGEDALDYDNLEQIYLGRDFSLVPPSFKKLHTVEIGNLVSKIPDSAFKNSLRLTNLNIGSGLTEIGAEAFKYCSLSDIIIPSKVHYIGNECFTGNRLNSITIGAGLSEIGDKAFAGNTNLSIISITAAVPPKTNVNAFTSYDAILNIDSRFSTDYSNSDICWSMFKQNSLINATNISLNAESIIPNSTEPIQLYGYILPENASLKTILWESSDPRIATVNANGLVTIRDERLSDNSFSHQSCIIRAYTLYSDGPIADCIFTNNLLVSSIILDPIMVKGKEGEQFRINATVLPEDATNKTIAWRSSNESVATVDNSGLISLLKEGTATITASATDDSGVSAECAIVVTEFSGIDEVETDKNAYVKIFNLSGVLVYKGIYSEANLSPDYYIVICDGKNVKVKVD